MFLSLTVFLVVLMLLPVLEDIESCLSSGMVATSSSTTPTIRLCLIVLLPVSPMSSLVFRKTLLSRFLVSYIHLVRFNALSVYVTKYLLKPVGWFTYFSFLAVCMLFPHSFYLVETP